MKIMQADQKTFTAPQILDRAVSGDCSTIGNNNNNCNNNFLTSNGNTYCSNNCLTSDGNINRKTNNFNKIFDGSLGSLTSTININNSIRIRRNNTTQ